MTDMTLYAPPIIFDRNAHRVPFLVRVADLMWCGAGLSCFQALPSRDGVIIPTAVYTVTLPLIHSVGLFDPGHEAIGEDFHHLLKCYFGTHGRLAIESIPSPASQCNVMSSLSGVRGWIYSHHARYVQALRHMWGCLDTGYAVQQWRKLGTKRKGTITRTRKMSHTELELRLSQYQQHGDQGVKLTLRNAVLFTRIFEAHFLPIHLFLVIICSGVYSSIPHPQVQCRILTMSFDFTAILRGLSYMIMIGYFAICYERYHRVCVQARAAEMKRAGLFEELKGDFTFRDRLNPVNYLDYVIFPVAGTMYGSVALLHAAFAHFWTDRLNYKVSAKPTRVVASLLDAREV